MYLGKISGSQNLNGILSFQDSGITIPQKYMTKICLKKISFCYYLVKHFFGFCSEVKHRGLICKLPKLLLDKHMIRIIMEFVRNRSFTP